MIKKRITIIFSLVGLVLVMAAGTSFAYFRVTRTQTDQNEVSSLDCLEVQMLNGTNAFNIQNAYPIKDEVGEEQIPYEFNLVNNCGQGVKVDIAFEVLSGSTLSANNLKVNLARHNGFEQNYILSYLPSGIPLNNGTAYIMRSDYLNGNETKDYDFRMWLPYELTEDDIHGQILNGKIIVTATASDNDLAGAPNGWDKATRGTLLYGIKKNYLEMGVPLTIPGKEYIYNKTSYISVTSSYKNYYFTYADDYEINSSNKFNLKNVTTAKYSTNYVDLIGKYIPSNYVSSIAKSSNTTSSYTDLSSLYLVLSATYDASKGTGTIYYKTISTVSNVSTYQQNYYCTYGEKVEHGYNLINPAVVKYSENYDELVGKYVSSNYFSSFCSSSSSMRSTNDLSSVYKIKDAKPNYVIFEYIREGIMSSAEDDYGTSYYFRGNINDNYVSFAGMCWRIVRILGNGAIKLTLYNYNPTGATNPCDKSLDGPNMAFARYSSTDSTIYTSFFNSENQSNNGGIGFMYSSNPNSGNYETSQANTNDSTVLTNLKSWYDNVFTASQKDKLADVIWCNDKRPVTDLSYNTTLSDPPLGTGIGEDITFYQTAKRIYPLADAEPSLKCGDNKTDNLISKFTASISTDDGYGNGKLNGYKIGLLTADEVAFAGSIRSTNYAIIDYYLFSNAEETYYTMSPDRFTGTYAFVHDVDNLGNIVTYNLGSKKAIRPAIALKSDTTISGGDGTQDNPFVVN